MSVVTHPGGLCCWSAILIVMCSRATTRPGLAGIAGGLALRARPPLPLVAEGRLSGIGTTQPTQGLRWPRHAIRPGTAASFQIFNSRIIAELLPRIADDFEAVLGQDAARAY